MERKINPSKNDYWRYQSKNRKEDYVIKITKVSGDKVHGYPVKALTKCKHMLFLIKVGWTIHTEPECWVQVEWPDLKPIKAK
ncbi:hypothetical protein CMI47_13145 [Candidatus Pacearchaeota archaeon]|nr:hypothetical protein [Candidatus Pacearchaeota archaeon]|tara:strand:- start:293 stop:538 length:246 start_codon:yes stop_codon:yes gene_type:complete